MTWVWKGRLRDLRGARYFLVAAGRLLFASLWGFQRNQGSLRAAGLTYLTMMGLVPFLAVIFAIANGFRIEESLRSFLQDTVSNSPDAFRKFMSSVLEVVQRVDFRTLGALGSLTLIYLVLSVMGRVEQAFNLTWKAETKRNLARRYADYVGVLFLFPALGLLATGMNTAFQLEGRLAGLQESIPWLAAILRSGLSFLPFFMLGLAATLVFKIVPNVRVRWIPAAVAGLVTGTCWLLLQWVFLKFQIGLAQANAVYGSLAFIPLFLFYIYFSWTILLWGGELCFGLQHLDDLKASQELRKWSSAARRRIGFVLMLEAARAFLAGKTLSLAEFAGRTALSRRFLDELVKDLEGFGLLLRVKAKEAVVPGAPPESIRTRALFEALDGQDLPSGRIGNPQLDEVLEAARARLLNAEGVLSDLLDEEKNQ